MEWDFSEFEGLLSGEQLKSGLDCLVDLKLGGFGRFGSFGEWKEQSKAAKATGVGDSGPSKTCKGRGGGGKNVCCLVDGCKFDLSRSREYHRRHKVCEAHSKVPIVLVEGKEQRFCQQCSRFHSLGEFDEVKRSCRKRLDGHNRRRRKPRLGATTSRSLFSTHPGSMVPPYPHILPNAAPNLNWQEAGKTGRCAIHRKHPSLTHTSYSVIYNEGKQFPFLLDDSSATVDVGIGSSGGRTFFTSISSSESGNNSGKIFSDGVVSQGLKSECALSLLSTPAHASTVALANTMPTLSNHNTVSPPVAIVPCWQSPSGVSPNGASSLEMDDWHAGVNLVPRSQDSVLGCLGIFNGGEFSPVGPVQASPFSWQ